MADFKPGLEGVVAVETAIAAPDRDGGAPARVLPMLDEVARTGDPEGYVKSVLDAHGKLMGFGHRVYRAEDPRSRVLKRVAQEVGSRLRTTPCAALQPPAATTT